MTKITPRPGDYVRTEGMTEEQYHAVAKAFMAAGAQGDAREYNIVRKGYAVGWSAKWGGFGCEYRPLSGEHFLRQLTIAQILGTEPDADGWIEWHGGECPVEKGTLVDARYRADDPSSRELADDLRWIHIDMGGDIIAYRIHQPEQEEAPMTIEQLLTKANKHAAKAAKHEAKREALIKQARTLMPEGWRLEGGGLVVQPGEDMTNPANWKAGDVVECIMGRSGLTKGVRYALRPTIYGAIYDEDEDVCVIDDVGDNSHYHANRFKWISRPQ